MDNNHTIHLSAVWQLRKAAIIQSSSITFSHQEQCSKVILNQRLAHITSTQLEEILQKHEAQRDATFTNGTNI